MALNEAVSDITARITERSRPTRSAYLAQLHADSTRPPSLDRMGCANIAHAVAGAPPDDRFKIVTERAPNIAIVTAYNDMLSAHTPLQSYPALIKDEARKQGATAQVAGGVPAMCDGVTQGTSGMELSLFSRDVIAMSTAVALSHDMFDAALLLGVCDKIVPGLLIGALQFGHLPTVFVPAGPMPSGLPNKEKARVREQAAQGLVGREGLLEAELKSYHSPGTCTFYGTANSNQMLLEAMGLHVPGTAFVAPGGPLRDELTREAVRTVLGKPTQFSAGPPQGKLAPSGGSVVREATSVGAKCRPIGQIVDERAIVNAMVALLATGGSTNHLIHWVAVAQSAGIVIDWNDFSALSDVVPLLTHVYPNGSADVNQFQAAGGTGLVIRELLDAGFMHEDVLTVREGGIREYTREPALAGASLVWHDAGDSRDETIVRPVARPFSPSGGLKLLQGNLGRSVIKVSAVPDDRHVIEAPARVFDSQEALLAAFNTGELERVCKESAARGVVCVVRWQGPQANGMPELHKLTPPLAVLQGKGFRVALVTDGRMSGASGKVPAAIHVSPEAAAGGPLAKVRDGDVIRVDAVTGQLQVLVPEAEWAARPVDVMPDDLRQRNGIGMGRGLFAGMRERALTAEKGALSWM
ncbi:MAG TPA: phosphogluconate dehydratase [Polaromonas sp.]|nr:phosphogluconate dehydratase [Polaromonas sp.]